RRPPPDEHSARGTRRAAPPSRYGLRRADLGETRILLGGGFRLSLGAALDRALAPIASKLGLSAERVAEVRGELLEFFRGRLKALWAEDARADVVEAVLAAGLADLPSPRARLAALSPVGGADDSLPPALALH